MRGASVGPGSNVLGRHAVAHQQRPGGSLDYWCIYEAGTAVTVESYREDEVQARHGGDPYLSVLQMMWRIHSLLAHARLAGRETPGVQQVTVRMDWRVIRRRQLMWDRISLVVPRTAADERSLKSVALRWTDLPD